MLRRDFLSGALATVALAGRGRTRDSGAKLAKAASAQLGVTKSYDPNYTKIPYPEGDVPRTTGVCADVVVRAARDGLSLDLQQLVHEDMVHNFANYPNAWGARGPDANIDHRRVLNLEAYWRRARCELWTASKTTAGNEFPGTLAVGDVLTWRLSARWPHIGVVVADSLFSTRIVHNWGNGAEESSLLTFLPHRAIGHYRWPKA